MTDFLPPNYVKPASASRYYKFQSGNNNFRILSPAITGWIDWTETSDGTRKPVRTKDKPEQSIDPSKPAKHFWSFVIWDYQEKNIKIMEITQATIQDAIFALHNSEDWGSPTEYDLCVNRVGEKMETKYSVIPKPPKPVSEEIAEALAKEKIDLNKLYDGEDPFMADKGNKELQDITF